MTMTTMPKLVRALRAAELAEMADPTPIDVAKDAWRAVRVRHGFAPLAPSIMSATNNGKTKKSVQRTYTLSLAQHTTSGIVNLCPWANTDCIQVCVAKNGNGAYPAVQRARIARVDFMVSETRSFVALVRHELATAVKYRDRYNAANPKVAMTLATRLNTFSDVPWQDALPDTLAEFGADISFYDYSKDPKRRSTADYFVSNSYGARMGAHRVHEILADGGQVSIVGHRKDHGGKVPTTYQGWPVVDGDKYDHRPTDGGGVVVFLKSKGRAMALNTGLFVADAADFAKAAPMA